MPITALVVDDHMMFRSLFASALSAIDIEVVGMGGSGEAAIRLADELKPQIVFLDIKMPPGMCGIKSGKIIKSKHPEIKVIACTAVDERFVTYELLRSGFDGLLLKGEAASKITEAVATVLQNKKYFDADVLAKLEKLPALSPYELDILVLLAEGKNHDEIAQQLMIKKDIFETNCNTLREKLGAKTDAHLISIASNLF